MGNNPVTTNIYIEIYCDICFSLIVTLWFPWQMWYFMHLSSLFTGCDIFQRVIFSLVIYCDILYRFFLTLWYVLTPEYKSVVSTPFVCALVSDLILSSSHNYCCCHPFRNHHHCHYHHNHHHHHHHHHYNIKIIIITTQSAWSQSSLVLLIF